MLKKFLIGTFALALMLSVGVLTADAFSGATLRVGSKGADVMELQTKLGLTADGIFGNMTKAAVMAFQASNGLTADGIAGPMTLAKMSAAVVGGTYPAGCTSNTGFSSTTGQSCAVVVTSLPPGCASTVGFSSTTGAKCDGGTPTPGTDNGPLVGGAGDLTLSGTSTDVEDSFKEGDEDVYVLGFEAEADGSDIALTNVKVLFSRLVAGSEDIADYADEVSIFMGSTKVGSADASDFSRDSGTPDIYSKTISLSNAVVREGKDAKFYVAVTASSNIDSDDVDDNSLLFSLDSVRYQDATGVIMSLNDLAGTSEILNDGNFDELVDLNDVSVDDKIEIKSSSSNPDSMTVNVDENDVTDEVLALAFKLDVDEDSSDVMITSIPVTVTFDNYDVDGDGTVEASPADASTSDSAAEKVIDSVIVKIGGEDYEADLDSGSVSLDGGAGTATYVVDFDDDELTINSGDVEDVKVYITFNDQDNNYNEGVILTASVESTLGVSVIEAETSEDDIDVDGSTKTGADLTLSLSSATVTVSSKDSSLNDAETIATFSFTFKVEAENGDVEFTVADVLATVLGPTGATPTEVKTLTFISGDATEAPAGTFTVFDGDSATFSLDITINAVDAGDLGVYRVRLTDVAGTDLGDDQLAGPETITVA